MKSLLLSLVFLFLTSASYGQQTCNIQTQGGIDTWPWQHAEPFPWDNIQGVWKLNTDSSDVYFKMKVTGQNKKGKILNISKFSTKNCTKPLATGVGFVGTQEKNIVRGVISDKLLRYQITLGLFETKQLSDDVVSCGDQVLAASMEVIGQRGAYNSPIDPAAYQIELMVLKKVPRSFESICKRPATR